MEQREPSRTVGGNAAADTVEKSTEVPQKLKRRFPYDLVLFNPLVSLKPEDPFLSPKPEFFLLHGNVFDPSLLLPEARGMSFGKRCAGLQVCVPSCCHKIASSYPLVWSGRHQVMAWGRGQPLLGWLVQS